jgi:hypothetical protein
MANWYILRHNIQYGPYTTQQMMSMDALGQLYAGDFIQNASTQQTLSLQQARAQWHSTPIPQQGAFYPYPNPVLSKAQQKAQYKAQKRNAKKRLPKWARLVVTGIICLGVVTVLGLAVWKIGDITGYWRDNALKNASSEWKKQEGFGSEEKAIRLCLKGFADALEQNDLATAMTFVYADDQQAIQELLTAQSAKIPVLLDALKTVEITYLSTEDGNYEALRMATVTVGKKTTSSGSSAGFTIVLVKTENGWVVSSL